MISYPKIKDFREIRSALPYIENPVSVQLKRDGSNVGIFVEDGELKLKTRNMDYAPESVYTIFEQCDKLDNVRDYFTDCSKDSVMFIELMVKGKSPARYELNDTASFVVIDIWWRGGFESPTDMYDACDMYNLPVVPQLAYDDRVVNYDDLIDKVDIWLQLAEGYEGIVVKTNTPNPERFKYKFYKPPKIVMTDNNNTLELLPDEEIYPIIHAVLMAADSEERYETKIMMPRIAKAVGDECKAQNKKVINLFKYYTEMLNEYE